MEINKIIKTLAENKGSAHYSGTLKALNSLANSLSPIGAITTFQLKKILETIIIPMPESALKEFSPNNTNRKDLIQQMYNELSK